MRTNAGGERKLIKESSYICVIDFDRRKRRERARMGCEIRTLADLFSLFPFSSVTVMAPAHVITLNLVKLDKFTFLTRVAFLLFGGSELVLYNC